jgi:hypothetical protein
VHAGDRTPAKFESVLCAAARSACPVGFKIKGGDTMNEITVGDRYAISWLLDFAQCDPRWLSPEEQRRVRGDLFTFSGDMQSLANFDRGAALTYTKQFGEDGPPEYTGDPLEPWTIVLRRHKVLKLAVSKLRDGKPCTLPYPHEIMLEAGPGGELSETFTGDADDIFFWMVSRLLKRVWPQVGTCAACARLFLREEGKSVSFCSRACQRY